MLVKGATDGSRRKADIICSTVTTTANGVGFKITWAEHVYISHSFYFSLPLSLTLSHIHDGAMTCEFLVGVGGLGVSGGNGLSRIEKLGEVYFINTF